MIQGTSSDAGKSLVAAGLCRLFSNRGLKVLPFKPQNMSNNAGVAADGGEIGRAQMLQARAARAEPSVLMNPVLLKPQSETGAQVIVNGRLWRSASAGEYLALKHELLGPVLESFRELSRRCDVAVVEGAGSPSEVNLRAHDIANMGFARAADVPVILVADIARGGVIANLVGTHAVLSNADRAMIRGFIVNKFRGDPTLFEDGARMVAERTGWAHLGTLGWFGAAQVLPAEDTLALEDASSRGGPLKVVVPRLPHIANFDDCDPLRLEPDVSLTFVEPPHALPGDADLILLVGSKSTLADAHCLFAAGWDVDIAAHVRRGGRVIGLCGGYQLLGRTIADPDGVEGPAGEMRGLGLLNVSTVLGAPKTTTPARGTLCHRGPNEVPVDGYRIHMGRTEGPDCARPVVRLPAPDGAMSPDGRVMGTYLHGLFGGDAARDTLLRDWGALARLAYADTVEETLDALAEHLAGALDVDAMLAMAHRKFAPTPA